MIEIRGLRIGEGCPKICVPIIERTQEDVLEMAEKIYAGKADIAEWRVDFFDGSEDIALVKETASLLRSVLRDKPLLFTFRTSNEGGEKDIAYEDYKKLIIEVAKAGDIDMADVEMYMDNNTSEFVCELKEYTTVVGSHHNFAETPDTDDMTAILADMYNSGADIPKLAVMPQSDRDVINLMTATLNAREILGEDIPVITMSMAKAGVISRIGAPVTGSAVTFGCIRKESAPGQVEVSRLKDILSLMV